MWAVVNRSTAVATVLQKDSSIGNPFARFDVALLGNACLLAVFCRNEPEFRLFFAASFRHAESNHTKVENCKDATARYGIPYPAARKCCILRISQPVANKSPAECLLPRVFRH